MNKPKALKLNKFAHRWGGITVLIAMFFGGMIGLPDWAFWALFVIGAGSGLILELHHWQNKAKGRRAPASNGRAKAMRVNKFIHRWTGLIWAAGMLLVFVGLPEGVLAVFLPMLITGLVLHIRHWTLRLRRKTGRRRAGGHPDPEAVLVR